VDVAEFIDWAVACGGGTSAVIREVLGFQEGSLIVVHQQLYLTEMPNESEDHLEEELADLLERAKLLNKSLEILNECRRDVEAKIREVTAQITQQKKMNG
jgi:hypothetical protein